MPTPTDAVFLRVADLIFDVDLQARESTNEAKVEEYAGDYARWADEGETPKFPPIDVHEIDGRMFVTDGFHRARGAKTAGVIEIAARVTRGSTRELAILAAAGSNTTHGLSRTNADKRKAVAKILGTEGGSSWSDRRIGRWCGVSQPFVGKIRAESTDNVISPGRRVGLDGKSREVASEDRLASLEELETKIESLYPGFRKVWIGLRNIRDREAYKPEHATFEAFWASLEKSDPSFKLFDITTVGTEVTNVLQALKPEFIFGDEAAP